MRVAALYDVHGNLPALDAVLVDPRCAAADLIVCGGDLVGGPMPSECLDRLHALGRRAVLLRGNGERLVATSEDASDAWCREQLGVGATDRLAGAPLVRELDVDGLGTTLFCHATPRSDEEILTRITPEPAVAEAFERRAGAAVVGHTHVQYDRRVGALRLVNAGSVGWPYEGRHGAFWALLGPGVELLSTTYDVDAAVEAIRSTGFPGAEDLAASLLEPPTAEEATTYFEGLRAA
jgi:predicted phosphodiesterase